MAVKKLIEVALPLEAINDASAREKSIRHGHPATLHLWWARRPLATARAMIWASLIDDPSSHPELFPTENEQNTSSANSTTYILNTNTRKYHYPTCSSVKQMKDKNKREYTGSRDEVIAQGYSPCQRCIGK